MALYCVYIVIATGFLIQSYKNMYIKEQHKIVKRQKIAPMYLEASCDLDCKPGFRQQGDDALVRASTKDSNFVEFYEDYQYLKPAKNYDQDCSYECRLYPRIIDDGASTTPLHHHQDPSSPASERHGSSTVRGSVSTNSLQTTTHPAVTTPNHATTEYQVPGSTGSRDRTTAQRRTTNDEHRETTETPSTSKQNTISAEPRPTSPMNIASVKTPTTIHLSTTVVITSSSKPTDIKNTTLSIVPETTPTMTIATSATPLPQPLPTPTSTTQSSAPATASTSEKSTEKTTMSDPTFETSTDETTMSDPTSTMTTMLVTEGTLETTTKNLSYYYSGGMRTESTPNWDFPG